MASQLLKLCDSIVDHIEAGGPYDLAFNVRADTWLWNFGVDTVLEQMQVVVVPTQVETLSGTRTELQKKVLVAVFVLLQNALGDTTKQDQVLGLAESLEARLYGVAQGQFRFEDFDTGMRNTFDAKAIELGYFLTAIPCVYMMGT